MPWYVYIAECADQTLYTGIALNPPERIVRHNAGRGSKYVRRKGGARLIYVQRCASKSAARRRETEIKSWSRGKKLALIANQERNIAGRG